jgi:hypothetical protein
MLLTYHSGSRMSEDAEKHKKEHDAKKADVSHPSQSLDS